MTTNVDIKAPYHIAFAGSLLGIIESASDIIFYDYWMQNSPINIQVSETQMMIQAGIGVVIATAIAGYLYYHHRNEDLRRDSFLYVTIAGLLALLVGGQLSSIITMIGAIICYRRY